MTARMVLKYHPPALWCRSPIGELWRHVELSNGIERCGRCRMTRTPWEPALRSARSAFSQDDVALSQFHPSHAPFCIPGRKWELS